MIILSPDPKDAVVQLSEAVNKLSGELAATTAFAIFYAQGKMTDDEMRTVQGIAQTSRLSISAQVRRAFPNCMHRKA